MDIVGIARLRSGKKAQLTRLGTLVIDDTEVPLSIANQVDPVQQTVLFEAPKFVDNARLPGLSRAVVERRCGARGRIVYVDDKSLTYVVEADRDGSFFSVLVNVVNGTARSVNMDMEQITSSAIDSTYALGYPSTLQWTGKKILVRGEGDTVPHLVFMSCEVERYAEWLSNHYHELTSLAGSVKNWLKKEAQKYSGGTSIDVEYATLLASSVPIYRLVDVDEVIERINAVYDITDTARRNMLALVGDADSEVSVLLGVNTFYIGGSVHVALHSDNSDTPGSSQSLTTLIVSTSLADSFSYFVNMGGKEVLELSMWTREAGGNVVAIRDNSGRLLIHRASGLSLSHAPTLSAVLTTTFVSRPITHPSN